jgi:hypothetical protein
MSAADIVDHPIHLGLGATAEIEPVFTGSMDWYDDYVRRHRRDAAEGRLVSLHTFSKSWDMWEMHPNGSEVVLCTAGSITLHQERADGTRVTTVLLPRMYAINEPGTWHTADVGGHTSVLFITAGWGTRHRPR